MKKFIITIDTEGDNLWNWSEGEEITTKNVYFLQRFQDLCDQYNFKPVWLSNWEMIQNADYVKFIDKGLERGVCELGMHLHAWNTPPITPLYGNKNSGLPYLIEYPVEMMEEKIGSITDLIHRKFGLMPISHRVGRWAMNDDYFQLLHKYGYKVDCSYTPGINWRKSNGRTSGIGGSDYSKVCSSPQIIHGICEVPVTTKKTRRIFVRGGGRTIWYMLKGQTLWLRPNGHNLKEMCWLVKECSKSEEGYLMFMLHSSELMPGGSPTFRDEGSIEILYQHLNIIFHQISKDYEGCTLEEYHRCFIK